MSRSVSVEVTSKISGTGTVRAYPAGSRDTLYEVPLYKVSIHGIDAQKNNVTVDFIALRFGVQLNPEKHVYKPKVVGLADAQTHTLSWSYITTMKQMAWRVYAGFFIHPGPDIPLGSSIGSIGCVEIAGPGEWDKFNNTIIALTGVAELQAIGDAKLVTAEYELAVRPALKLWK